MNVRNEPLHDMACVVETSLPRGRGDGRKEDAQHKGIWQDRQNYSPQGTTQKKVCQAIPVDPQINV